MLEAVGLYKTFKSGASVRYPLLGASLSVDDGEKVGIFGDSGEGKSTFANILCGLVVPDAGNVYLDEIPLYGGGSGSFGGFGSVGKLKSAGISGSGGRLANAGKCGYNARVGRKIQIIPQQPYLSLDPTQRVGSAVAEVLRAKRYSAAEAKKRACELFEKVALDVALMDRLPSQLSGGQVQRVAIARALATQPDVLVSDEATAMLDTASQAQIVRIFDKIAKDDGISVIMISHDLKLIRSFADRIYRLENGVFDEYDAFDEYAENEEYAANDTKEGAGGLND